MLPLLAGILIGLGKNPTNQEVFLSKCVAGRDVMQPMADNKPWKHKQLMQFEIFSMNECDHHMQNHCKQLKPGEEQKAFLIRSETRQGCPLSVLLLEVLTNAIFKKI